MHFKSVVFGTVVAGAWGIAVLMAGALAFVIGVGVGTSQTLELVSAALGYPVEEVKQQIEWYLEPVQEAR